jgi:hypothetical protein
MPFKWVPKGVNPFTGKTYFKKIKIKKMREGEVPEEPPNLDEEPEVDIYQETLPFIKPTLTRKGGNKETE